ncbi:glycosyl hydrolase, family 43 [Bifidobacterium sp. DSM 109958]|uniref:Glycosyl hydrolase, family 43 n=1 Tax=Bifidobacterium moraviense TaxID=2675323 RepID=A0A7Y0HZE5_9BIFI|nr:family 43 glycosylhydrolase [Bifidobacterium sp. DSM 109958]NMN00323.1 glycosyl hydrolase, family 43 [Bifidobacterium sp. DSM 109958]
MTNEAAAAAPAHGDPNRAMIHNPILPGFNPDPNIFTDDRRYYIAVSTFTWVPGVRVYASNDLVEWRYETSVLATPALADFAGRPDNMGIWAPMMTWHDGLYYLIYTDVATTQRPFADAANYIVTAPDIRGPWSEPVYVNGSGFDPSIFFDDDGAMYVVNELWDYRVATHNKSAGVVLQQVDARTFAPIGEPRRIFDGTAAAKTEAPHIVRHDGWYYLITAEGGTGSGHQVTVCRSRGVWGPYEVDPANPMLTSADDPSLELQCAGHGSVVSTPDGEWYMAHLCTRPLRGGHAVLGREAALQRVTWTDDGWLRLAGSLDGAESRGGNHPAVDVPAPRAYRGGGASVVTSFEDDFSGGALDFARWNTPRELPGDWLAVGDARCGGDHEGCGCAAGLTLAPGASPQSTFGQHMVATRQTDFAFEATVTLDYVPHTYLDMAGMLLYLDTKHYLFLAVTRDERLDGRGGPVIARLMANHGDTFSVLADMELDAAGDAARAESAILDGGVGAANDTDAANAADAADGADAAGDEIVSGGTIDLDVAIAALSHTLTIRVDRTTASFAVDGRELAGGIDVTFLSGGFTGDFIALTNVGMNRRGDAVAACDPRSLARFRRFSYRAH